MAVRARGESIRSPAVGSLEFYWRGDFGSGRAISVSLTAVFDAQHGGFTTGWSPVSWGSIDELFVNHKVLPPSTVATPPLSRSNQTA